MVIEAARGDPGEMSCLFFVCVVLVRVIVAVHPRVVSDDKDYDRTGKVSYNRRLVVLATLRHGCLHPFNVG